MKADIAIIGGAGHIGLPLGMLFAANHAMQNAQRSIRP